MFFSSRTVSLLISLPLIWSLTEHGLLYIRSTFQEEVGESLVPPPVAGVAHVPAVPQVVEMMVEQEAVGHVRAAANGDAQILAAKPSAAVRMDSSPSSMELSTGKMNPRAPGWNKRLVLSDRERCCEEGNCSI